MLDETWQLKRELSDAVSNSTIDDLYERACAAGAIGGKLLGAGGSGFMLFYVKAGAQNAVRKSLSHLVEVPFGFEMEGSSVVQNGIP